MSNPSEALNSRVRDRDSVASRRAAVRLCCWAGIAAALLTPRRAPAQTMPQPPAASRPTAVRPPPINVSFLQFGVAFTGTRNLGAGAVCASGAKAPCILGSGGGIIARAGYRSRGPWYVGGAYEFNRIDTRGIMRLGSLQVARAEMRYYFNLGLRTEPYFVSGLGAVAFGDEWKAETFGATTFAGLGLEFELTRTSVIGAAFLYRPLLLARWTDQADQLRETGVAHFLGLEITLEDREPLGFR